MTCASYAFDLAPHEAKRIFLTAAWAGPDAARPVPFMRGLLAAHRELRAATSGMTTIETSNDLFNEVLCRSAADLAMLMTDTPQGRYPYAGIPWYSTTFGRDGLITALQMLWCDPRIARGVLSRLGAFQARSSDPLSDAEPGKILHEMRDGEMAALGEVPFRLYYGSVDSTPLFVLLAGLYVERTGDDILLAELWPSIEAALHWIDGDGDPDQDGFVEYYRKTEKGLANQGWKDSHDAVFHADGGFAEGPIALAEVQGYVFAAKQVAARCARRLKREDRANQLEAQAARLAERFEDAFWCDDIRSYALALDGNKRPCAVRTSNAGQVLFSGIAREDRARLVGDLLMSPAFFSGWGIRTVARGEARYNPMSYHNGSVWPHDNALIALGFARYGLKRAVGRLATGLSEAAAYMDLAQASRAVLRIPARAAARAYPLSGRLRAAGLGERDAVLADRGHARPRIPSRDQRDPPARSQPACLSRPAHAAQFSRWWLEHGFAGPSSWRRGLDRSAAGPRQDPGLGRSCRTH